MASTVLGLPDEGRDLLMRAALAAPDRALEAWQQWVETGAPWRDPVATRWLPLVGWNLRNARLDARSTDALREVQRGTWAANVRLLTAAIPTLEAFAAQGIRTMVLKGAPLATLSFERAGLRPLGDIDVLVEPERAEEARGILARQGWTPARFIPEADLAVLHGFDYVRPPYGALDLHWYLLHESCWPHADEGVWGRARPIVVAGHATLAPSAADQLLHVCVHGLRWSPVHSAHWVADAIRLIGDGAGLDWDVLVEESRARRLEHQAHRALSFLRDEWNAAVPAEVLQRLRGRGPSLVDRVECHVKGRPRASFGGLFVIWRNWRRLERAPARSGFLRYLSATVGVHPAWKLVPWLGRHLAIRLFAPWRRPRGTSSQEKLDTRSALT